MTVVGGQGCATSGQEAFTLLRDDTVTWRGRERGGQIEREGKREKERERTHTHVIVIYL